MSSVALLQGFTTGGAQLHTHRAEDRWSEDKVKGSGHGFKAAVCSFGLGTFGINERGEPTDVAIVTAFKNSGNENRQYNEPNSSA